MTGNDWITSPDNVREYANSMKNRISNSKDVRPDVIRTVNLALQDMGTEPTYIVLIGDASDYNTGGTDLTSVETVKAQRTENVYLGGCSVRIESDIVNQAKKYPYDSELQEYKRAYDEFSNILDVKYEVSHNELNSQNQQSSNFSI